MKRIIQIVEDPYAEPGVVCAAGAYVVSYDPDGETVLTTLIEKARRFDTAGEALVYWRQQSVACPLRPDGKPNRPLTAYTVSVEAVDD